MQKFFLFKSDDDFRNLTGDVFVSLKHIQSLKLAKRDDDDYVVAAVLDNDNGVIARFTSEKKAKSFIHSLFEAMGENPEMLEKFKYFKIDRKKEEFLKILGTLKDKLSD